MKDKSPAKAKYVAGQFLLSPQLLFGSQSIQSEEVLYVRGYDAMPDKI